tara:strand:+ start:1148 stop:1564 length:417 start_codon:yes stop_codon:yes gene_type:complete
MLTYEGIQDGTGLPMPDVRIGVLDLVGAGLLEKSETMSSSRISPLPDLFVTFDAVFMDWSPEVDARELANYLHNLEVNSTNLKDVDSALNWGPRRLNAAAAFLISARIVGETKLMGSGKYWPTRLNLGDELLRYVKSL